MSARDILSSFNKVHVSVIVITSAMAALGGAAVGAKLAIDKLGDKLREEADLVLKQEIAQAKTHYKREAKQDEFASPETALAALHPEAAEAAATAIMNYQGITKPTPPAEELVEVAKNVFTDAAIATAPFDYARELEIRDPEKPYLITDDEFNENEFDYEQISVTYYEGDGVLANPRDEPIDNIEQTVGSQNLMRFGQGSNDENIVYVRNVSANLDFEIALSKGKYAVEVAGFDEEESSLSHSYSRPSRKFRDTDD